MSNAPVIWCRPTEDGGRWTFICIYCDKRHWHGAVEGHRVAHCVDNSGAPAKDYYLKEDRRVMSLAMGRRAYENQPLDVLIIADGPGRKYWPLMTRRKEQ